MWLLVFWSRFFVGCCYAFVYCVHLILYVEEFINIEWFCKLWNRFLCFKKFVLLLFYSFVLLLPLQIEHKHSFIRWLVLGFFIFNLYFSFHLICIEFFGCF